MIFGKKLMLIAPVLLPVLSILSFSQPKETYYYQQYHKQNSQFSENTVYDLIVDEQGFLWIAAPNGLFKFNGFSIERYPADPISGINTVFQTIDKKMLIACGRDMFEVKNKAFKPFKPIFQSLPDSSRDGLMEILAAYHIKKSFFYIQKPEWAIPSIFTISKNNKPLLNLYPLDNNRLFARTDAAAFLIERGQKPRLLYTILRAEDFQDVYMNDQYWLYNNKTSLFINAQNGNVASLNLPIGLIDKNEITIYNNIIGPPVLISKNQAWLLKKNQKTNRYEWEFITAKIPTGIFIFRAIFHAGLNKLFLGSIADGLLIFTKQHFSTTEYNLPKNNADFYAYYLQIPLKRGDILGQVPNQLNNMPPEFNNLTKGKYININYAFINDSIVISNTSRDYFLLNTSSLIPRKIGNGDTSIGRTSYVKSGNFIYLFTEKAILRYNLAKNTFEKLLTLKENLGLVNHAVTVNGNIWLAHCNGMLVYNPETNRIIHEKKSSTCLRYFFKYKNSIIYTTYGSGLFLIDSLNFSIKPLKLDYYQALKRTHFIYADKHKYLWASTNEGILRFSCNTFDKVISGGDFVPQPQYFDSKNGLPTDEMNGGTYPPYVNYGDTALSIPCIKGFIKFHPLRDFPQRTNQHNIEIKEIRALARIISWKDKLEFDHTIQEFKVTINTVLWDNHKNLNLFYRYDGELHFIPFSELNNLNIVVGNNGEHLLEFLFIDDFGQEKVVKTIPITKSSPWYLRFGYIILFSIFLLVLIILTLWLRSKNIKRKNEKLKQIIDEKTLEIREINTTLLLKISELTQLNKINNIYISVINHDIFAPIKYINLVGDKVYEYQNKLKKSDILNHFELIINSTKRLEILCSNILNERSTGNSFRQIQKDIAVYQMLTDLNNFIKIGLQINQNKLAIKVPKTLTVCTSQNALNIILTNLISNANRFTKNGQISVEYNRVGEHHQITVSDTGNGMPIETLEKIQNRTLEVNHKDGTEFQSYGIGYSLIFKMLDIIEGTITVSSELQKGTTIVISFPDLIERSENNLLS